MKNRVLEIPVHPVVKAFFEHPSNLGKNATIEKRHWIGRHISSCVSYIPLEPKDLPVGVTERDLEKLVIYKVKVSFPLKIEQLTMHHYFLLGQVMESIFEISILNFCKGRFVYSLNYSAAITDFFERYGLDKVDFERDNYRRFVNKKYGEQVQELYNECLEVRNSGLSAIEKKS